MIIPVENDIFDFVGYGLVLHAVDCAGNGFDPLSRRIESAFPAWRWQYLQACAESSTGLVGHVNSFEAAPNVRICDCFDISEPNAYKRLSLDAWERIFRIVEKSTVSENAKRGPVWRIHAQRLIGCRLGESEWPEMKQMLEYVFGNSPVKLFIHG